MKIKKSQSTIEFLMTYGWVIVVIVLAIVILWQMNPFTPVPCEKLKLGFSQVMPTDWAAYRDSNTLVFRVENWVGDRVEVKNANAVIADVKCSASPTVIINPGENAFLILNCLDTPSLSDRHRTGDCYTADVRVTYINKRNGNFHESIGKLRGVIEEGVVTTTTLTISSTTTTMTSTSTTTTSTSTSTTLISTTTTIDNPPVVELISPPDGNIIPIGEILRPNGEGSETSISNASGCVNHWECVDEVTADDGATYVYTAPGGPYERDLYTLQDHSASGVGIESVTVYFRVKRGLGGGNAKASIRTYSTTYDGSVEPLLTAGWNDYSYTWTTNPFTGSAWTWDEIDGLEAGVNLRAVCLIKGTKVLMADGTYKNIEDIKAGDYVTSFNLTTGEFKTTRVVSTYQGESNYLLFNNKLGASPDHRIYVIGKGFIPARDIKVGDYLLNENNEKVRVNSIENISEEAEVYNINLESPNNFFADGYLVHNSYIITPTLCTQVYVKVKYSVVFTYKPTDDNSIASCSLWTNISGAWQIDQTDNTITNGGINSFTVTDIPTGMYKWNVECTDNVGQSAFAPQNWTFTIVAAAVDNPPVVELISPPDGDTIPADIEGDWSISYDPPVGANIIALEVYNGKLYAASYTAGIIYIYDGTSWTISYNGTGDDIISSLAVYNGKLYAGGYYTPGFQPRFYVYDGTSWTTGNMPSGNIGRADSAVYNGKLYISGGCSINVYDGTSWTTTSPATPGCFGIETLEVYNGELYAGVDVNNGIDGGQVYVYDGTSWSPSLSLDYPEVYLLALGVYDGKLYAGTGMNDGLIYAYDGTSWAMSHNSSDEAIYALGAYNGKLYAGGFDSGTIYVYDGTSWGVSYDIPEQVIISLETYNGELYAGSCCSTGNIYVYSETAMKNITFTYNATDDNSINSCSLYTDIPGTWQIDQTDNTITNGGINDFMVNNIPVGSYKWNVECTDNIGQSAFAPSNWTFTVS